MQRKTRWMAGGSVGAVLLYHVVIGWGPAQAKDADPAPAAGLASAAAVPLDPEREAYFGDLHLHTTNSYDAYILLGTRTGPDEAYRFARGETIDYLGQPVRRDVPLDFMAVTDHSENLGVFNQLDDPNSELSLTEIGRLARQGGYQNFTRLLRQLGGKAFLGNNAKAVSASAWQRSIDATNANYRPGKFTTFVGYEWTSMPDNQNLHRNVIFRGAKAPSPFSRFDSEDPVDLWTWLGKIRGQGYDALAISHNANVSNGLMFDWNSIGAAQLTTIWTDPAFRRDQAAVYYVRVLEIPTPRWSTLRAIEYGLPLPQGAPPTLQERAWTSPIWYTPPAQS